jgi:18S rRNA (adenine1779-N6/adenine1780-N6)-dimethyltransferase
MAKPSSNNSAGGGSTANNPIFNKQLGQHILKNPLVAQGIVDKAGVLPTDTVFEIGPGTGNLTVKILERAKRVIVVERDPRLAAELIKRVQGTPEQRKLQVIIGDVLQAELPFFDVCISNTPYQISSPLTFKLLLHRPRFRCAVLMFQREFALRMVARPGDSLYCRLSVNVQYEARCQHIMKISKNSFRPPPKVESSVVRLEPKARSEDGEEKRADFAEWDGLIRILFSRKNKTIAASMNTNDVLGALEKSYKTHCSLNSIALPEGPLKVKEMVFECIKEAGLEGKRSSKLGLDDYTRLLSCFHKAGFRFASSSPSSASNLDLYEDEEEDVEMQGDSDSE